MSDVLTSACRTLRRWELDALGAAALAPPPATMLVGAEITAAWIRARCAVCGTCPDLTDAGLTRPAPSPAERPPATPSP